MGILCSICMYISVPCLCALVSVPREAREVSNPLGLELRVVVCHLMGAGSSGPLKEQPVHLIAEHLLPLKYLHFEGMKFICELSFLK